MHIIKYTLFLFGLSLATLSQAEPVRYMAATVEGTIVEFSKDKESILLMLSDETLIRYKIQHYTSHSHKPTTFADARGYKLQYSALAGAGYVAKARLSLSGEVVTHLAIVKLEP